MKPCLWWILAKKQLFLTHETLHKNKKQKPQNHLKPPWNPVSFTKTDKLETWNHFWFHENWQKSKSSLKINLWSLKLARFQNESEDRLHWEDALIFAKEDEFWLFCSFQDLICPKIRCLARSFFLKGKNTRFFCLSKIPYKRGENSISLA